MSLLRRFAQYIRTFDGRVSFCIVLSCALVVAIFVGRTFVDPLPKQYPLDFGAARWIQKTGATSAEAGYFRKSLYISAPVEQAWIQLAATGNYTLYVNNVLVGTDQFPCVRLTGLYDLKKILSQGKNVIAVYVPAGAYPGPAQILVRGSYSPASSPPQEFKSDGTWKVSFTPDGVISSYPWSSPALDDTLWANAEQADSDELISTLQPVSVDPRLLQTRPTAKWVAAKDGSAKQVSFAYSLDLPLIRGETWLQVAATGAYDLIINGRSAAVWTIPAQAQLAGPDAPVMVSPQTVFTLARMPIVVSPNSGLPGSQTPAVAARVRVARYPLQPATISPLSTIKPPSEPEPNTTTEIPELLGIPAELGQSMPQLVQLPPSLGESGGVPLLVAYNVTDWTSWGRNSILIRVRSDYGPPLLLAEGYAYVDGRPSRGFRSDGSWRALVASKSNPADNAIVVAGYGDQMWGTLPQVPADPQSLPDVDSWILLRWIGVIVAVVGAVWVCWFAASAMCAAITGGMLEQVWSRDALLHFPLLAVLLLLLLLSYDVRLPDDWCFTPAVTATAVAFILASKLFLLATSTRASSEEDVLQPSHRTRFSSYWKVAALVVVVIAGLAVRASGLLEDSLSADETSMIRNSYGVLTWGFPYMVTGSFTKLLATYELVPYPLALSSIIFGHTELAYRLPSLIFGTLTIGLVGWVGYRMMDWRVGLMSALIYAFLPTPIGWARDAFYPSQQAFFSLLTFWLFYEAIRGEALNHRYFTLSALTFMLTYLSWEGSGFILPTLWVVILALRWGRFDWISDWHLWRCFLVVSALVVLQLCYREIVKIPDYLGLVYDLSEITTPSVVFLNRLLFAPFYYAGILFFAENHFALSLLLLVGIAFMWRNAAIRYLFISLMMLELCLTCMLPHYAPRYCFSWLALLVLASVGVCFGLLDRVATLAARFRPAVSPALITRSGSCLALLLLIVASNPFLLKLYRLSFDPTVPPFYARLGKEFQPNYRAADRYVSQHWSSGDGVVTRASAIYEFYNKKPVNYAMNTMLSQRITYDAGMPTLRYIDKFVGAPSIRSLEELEDVASRYPRLWVFTSIGKTDDSADVFDYVHKRGRVMLETFNIQVSLLQEAQDIDKTTPTRN